VNLPDEIIQLILSFLPGPDLKRVALSSRCLYAHATDPLWRKVCLSDTWTLHLNDDTCQIWGERGQGESDEHDDTPMIQKLFVLARNPYIASKVHVVTHCCHLPTPGIFSELPYMHFDSDNLSQPVVLHDLVQLAIRNLVNVHTLRIIYGHKNITSSLLEGFLSPNRPRCRPLRRLWLESCSLSGARIDWGALPTGLESIRIRRLRAEVISKGNNGKRLMQFPEFRISRWGHSFWLHDGAGGFFWTAVQFGLPDAALQHRRIPQASPEQIDEKANEFDAGIWEGLPEVTEYLNESLAENQLFSQTQEATVPEFPLLHLLRWSPNITKLNLDWVIWRPKKSEDDESASTFLQELSRMRFLHLRAFQIRNAVVEMTRLPSDIYLLESTFLDFLEAHPKITCLAFPLDKFYSHKRPSQDVVIRSRKLIAHFATVLVDLRLDSCYNNNGDPVTDEEITDLCKEQERIRRRRFINEFAPYLTRIEHIKLEGGIPRDEKREILRALRLCPLKRIVMIGASFPVGNTWGHHGENLKVVDEGVTDHSYDLEEEDWDGVMASVASKPAVSTTTDFTPRYGWPPAPAFLDNIAADHAATVEELKLCGFNGSPVLSNFLPVTKPILFPLRHFHNLRQLIISFWLITYFEDEHRDMSIIQSWKDSRSPSSTALVVVTSPTSPTTTNPFVNPTVAVDAPHPAARPQEFNRWAVALKTRFTPSALAYRVAADIGPFLSPIAKERKGGVRVRASFCLGERGEHRSANDIFDLDMRIGRDNKVLEFVGPREEGEKGRWWDKLDGRRWF
jgi:hypothetical protein